MEKWRPWLWLWLSLGFHVDAAFSLTPPPLLSQRRERPWKEQVEDALWLQCDLEGFRLELPFSEKAAPLLSHELRKELGSVAKGAVGPCPLQRDSRAEELRLSWAFQACQTLESSADGFRSHVAQLRLNLSSESFLLSIECRRPQQAAALGGNVSEILLAASASEDESSEWLQAQSSLSRPYASSLFLQAKPSSHPWIPTSFLFALPVHCWLSHSPNAEAETGETAGIRRFLSEGCPSLWRSRKGLASLHRVRNGPTKVAIKLGRPLLTQEELSKPLYAHCTAIPCVQARTIAFPGLPKCPREHFCSGVPENSHRLPDYLRGEKTLSGSFGPFLVPETPLADVAEAGKGGWPAEDGDDGRGGGESCESLCERRLAVELGRREHQRSLGVWRKEEGISLPVTVALALVSFLAGLGLTLAISWIQHRYPVHGRSEADAKAKERAPLNPQRPWTELSEKSWERTTSTIKA